MARSRSLRSAETATKCTGVCLPLAVISRPMRLSSAAAKARTVSRFDPTMISRAQQCRCPGGEVGEPVLNLDRDRRGFGAPDQRGQRHIDPPGGGRSGRRRTHARRSATPGRRAGTPPSPQSPHHQVDDHGDEEVRNQQPRPRRPNAAPTPRNNPTPTASPMAIIWISRFDSVC